MLDKLAHITQLTAELCQLVVDEMPEELPIIEVALGPVDDHVHRLSKQLSQMPIGAVQAEA